MLFPTDLIFFKKIKLKKLQINSRNPDATFCITQAMKFYILDALDLKCNP